MNRKKRVYGSLDRSVAYRQSRKHPNSGQGVPALSILLFAVDTAIYRAAAARMVAVMPKTIRRRESRSIALLGLGALILRMTFYGVLTINEYS